MDVTEKELQERYASQDTDELLELTAGGNLTEEALRIAEAELRKRGLDPPTQSVVSDKVVQSAKTPTEANPLVRFFRGEIALWKTFWFGMFLPSGVVNVLVRDEVIGSFFAACVVGVLAIGVYRSAIKYRGSRGWPVAAVLYTILYIVGPFILY